MLTLSFQACRKAS